MAGGAKSSNASRQRKRVEAESESESVSQSLKRARDGSAFTKCEECKKDVAVALINFHNCSLDAKIKMNLEAQVVEMATEAKKKPAAEKKKAKPSEPKANKEKTKNPNAKKRPPTAFFVFMDDFRKSFKEANPDCKSVATVAKEGGEKWKSMSDEEKKVYQDKAAELKAEYQKSLEADEPENEQEGEGESEAKDENIKEEKDDSTDEEVKEEKEEAKEKVEEVEEEILDDF